MTLQALSLPFEIGWTDVVDILLVAFLIYQLYKIIKGTVAIKIFVGILAIYLLWQLFQALQMELVAEILGQFIGVGAGPRAQPAGRTRESSAAVRPSFRARCASRTDRRG